MCVWTHLQEARFNAEKTGIGIKDFGYPSTVHARDLLIVYEKLKNKQIREIKKGGKLRECIKNELKL